MYGKKNIGRVCFSLSENEEWWQTDIAKLSELPLLPYHSSSRSSSGFSTHKLHNDIHLVIAWSNLQVGGPPPNKESKPQIHAAQWGNLEAATATIYSCAYLFLIQTPWSSPSFSCMNVRSRSVGFLTLAGWRQSALLNRLDIRSWSPILNSNDQFSRGRFATRPVHFILDWLLCHHNYSSFCSSTYHLLYSASASHLGLFRRVQ